jgi:transposase-like protein
LITRSRAPHRTATASGHPAKFGTAGRIGDRWSQPAGLIALPAPRPHPHCHRRRRVPQDRFKRPKSHAASMSSPDWFSRSRHGDCDAPVVEVDGVGHDPRAAHTAHEPDALKDHPVFGQYLDVVLTSRDGCSNATVLELAGELGVKPRTMRAWWRQGWRHPVELGSPWTLTAEQVPPASRLAPQAHRGADLRENPSVVEAAADRLGIDSAPGLPVRAAVDRGVGRAVRHSSQRIPHAPEH